MTKDFGKPKKEFKKTTYLVGGNEDAGRRMARRFRKRNVMKTM